MKLQKTGKSKREARCIVSGEGPGLRKEVGLGEDVHKQLEGPLHDLWQHILSGRSNFIQG